MGCPLPVEVWTDKQTENSTFPHPSDAGGNDFISVVDISVLEKAISLVVQEIFVDENLMGKSYQSAQAAVHQMVRITVQ